MLDKRNLYDVQVHMGLELGKESLLARWQVKLLLETEGKAWHGGEVAAAATAAKSPQSCLTLCDPRDGSPPGSPVPGILQARTLSPPA